MINYFYEMESSQSLIANLLEVRPGFEFNNYNFKLRRSVLEADYEPRIAEFEEDPSLIASIDGSFTLSLLSYRSSVPESID